MASDISTYWGNKLIRYLAGNAMPTAPTGLWVALYDGDPKASGTEITTTIRSGGRVEMTVTEPSAGVDNNMVNDADVDFGLSEGDADVSHFAICDAASAGNILMSDVVPGGPVAVALGGGVKFLAGALEVEIGS